MPSARPEQAVTPSSISQRRQHDDYALRQRAAASTKKPTSILDPGGQNIEMAISVTGVINLFSPYNGPPEAGWRGNHASLYGSLGQGNSHADPDPEGIDCSGWFAQLQGMSLWNEVEVLASELTMTRKEWSVGGRLTCSFARTENPFD